MTTMKEYTVYCTEDQTKRAVKLGAPIPPYKGGTLSIKTLLTNKVEWYSDIKEPLVKDDENLYIIPTTQQMMCWLRERGHRFYVVCDINNSHHYKIEVMNDKFDNLYSANGVNYQEAELAAIDAALDYLEKGETK